MRPYRWPLADRGKPFYAQCVHRSARVLAGVLALSLTGCDHRSKHHQAAPPRAPSPYTPRAVQRAFATEGVPLTRDSGMESFVRTSGHVSNFAAFFTDSIGDVQVTVRRREPTSSYVIITVAGSATKTQGNVEVTYPKRGSQARRVLRALTLLRKARLHA